MTFLRPLLIAVFSMGQVGGANSGQVLFMPVVRELRKVWEQRKGVFKDFCFNFSHLHEIIQFLVHFHLLANGFSYHQAEELFVILYKSIGSWAKTTHGGLMKPRVFFAE